MYNAALELAKAGWRVFPVSADTKRPRNKHGHLEATTDPKRLRIWQHQFDWGGAIATPTGDGLLVVDVDPRNGGKVPHWAPETLTVKTQSGGLHLYYAIDKDIKSRAGLFGPGVDSKCRGGYVLVPPSPGYEYAHIRPRARVTYDWIERFFVPEQREGATRGARRLPPEQWRRGIIHDQAVAWAAYFASVMDDDRDVTAAVWDMVNAARAAGIHIDNARGHIDGAIRWVLEREHQKGGLDDAPALA